MFVRCVVRKTADFQDGPHPVVVTSSNILNLKLMKIPKRFLFAALFGMLSLQTNSAEAVVATQPTYLPNLHGKSLTTPVAWGGWGNIVFAGVGGTDPSPYTTKADGAAVLGVGLGNPYKNIGVQICLISIDVSAWQEYSMGLHLFHNLDNASAVGVGVENVMITSGGDSGKSYYVVYSHGVQSDSFINKTTGGSKLHYSIGAGNGRFGDKSPLDISSGKGAHGTYVFSNVAYEVANSFNIITDWNGVNLNAGVSKTFMYCGYPIAATIGVADLTHYSGDGPRAVFSVGTGFKL